MGRYTGPRERLSRRAGVDLELKGERRAARKGGAGPPPQPPGPARAALRPAAVHLLAPAERQAAAKRYYGVREGQFRRYVEQAQRTVGVLTGDRLLQLLELRLDNMLVRLGFATTRAQARQFVVHGHVDVNGRRCDIPSRRLREGDVVVDPPGSAVRRGGGAAADLIARCRRGCSWTRRRWWDGWSANHTATRSRRPLDEQLIVEFYSRV